MSTSVPPEASRSRRGPRGTRRRRSSGRRCWCPARCATSEDSCTARNHGTPTRPHPCGRHPRTRTAGCRRRWWAGYGRGSLARAFSAPWWLSRSRPCPPCQSRHRTVASSSSGRRWPPGPRSASARTASRGCSDRVRPRSAAGKSTLDGVAFEHAVGEQHQPVAGVAARPDWRGRRVSAEQAERQVHRQVERRDRDRRARRYGAAWPALTSSADPVRRSSRPSRPVTKSSSPPAWRGRPVPGWST